MYQLYGAHAIKLIISFRELDPMKSKWPIPKCSIYLNSWKPVSRKHVTITTSRFHADSARQWKTVVHSLFKKYSRIINTIEHRKRW